MRSSIFLVVCLLLVKACIRIFWLWLLFVIAVWSFLWFCLICLVIILFRCWGFKLCIFSLCVNGIFLHWLRLNSFRYCPFYFSIRITICICFDILKLGLCWSLRQSLSMWISLLLSSWLSFFLFSFEVCLLRISIVHRILMRVHMMWNIHIGYWNKIRVKTHIRWHHL